MSYLKPPPADPIEIEGDVFYNYVIAQSGATAISVEPDADFEFHMIVDAPALLRLKFIGDIPEVDPIYRTITVNLAFPEGRAVHEINLKILVLAPLLGRRLPNITTVRRLNVAPNAYVDFRILTDLPRCNGTTITENCVESYAVFAGLGANVLPGSMTINSFGRISGRAPNTNSTWVLSLRASSWHGNRYIRYMVLFVGNGGDDPPLDTEPPEIIPDPGGGPPPPEVLPPEPIDTDPIGFGLPPLPGPFYDGDYTIPQIAGMPEYEIPFKDDPKPYIYKMTYWQFLYNYADIELGTPGPIGYGGVYVGLVPGSFKQIGGGVVEFKREFAMNPPTRNEYETFVYDYHFVFFTFGFPNFCTQSTPLLVHSRIQYDYYYSLNPGTEIPLPHAPKLLETCLGLVMRGEFPDTNTESGEEVLAEDATYKIWRPGIYERRMRFVKWVSSLDLWFNTP